MTTPMTSGAAAGRGQQRASGHMPRPPTVGGAQALMPMLRRSWQCRSSTGPPTHLAPRPHQPVCTKNSHWLTGSGEPGGEQWQRWRGGNRHTVATGSVEECQSSAVRTSAGEEPQSDCHWVLLFYQRLSGVVYRVQLIGTEWWFTSGQTGPLLVGEARVEDQSLTRPCSRTRACWPTGRTEPRTRDRRCWGPPRAHPLVILNIMGTACTLKTA